MVAQPSPVSERPDADAHVAVDPARLKAAVRNGELELRYQPEVDLLTGEIVALEGLIRWSCPGVGAVSPRDFLPLAQDLGLMPTIDSWVLETGAAQAAVWREDYGQNRLLWLNVSMDSVLDEAFVYRIIGTLDRHRLPPGELGLEISERLLLALGDAPRGCWPVCGISGWRWSSTTSAASTRPSS